MTRPRRVTRGMVRPSPALLWLRWVGANALAELVGLGATFCVDYLIVSQVAARGTILASLAAIPLMTASGAIEGATVGVLQSAVLRRPFPRITPGSWVGATVVGAVVAWFLGSLPSSLMDMGAQTSGDVAQEPTAAVVMLLAAAMGLALGAVLAYPQWRVLRAAARRSWLWIPANCLAWAVGMPATFAAIDRAQASASLVGTLLAMAFGLLIAGALVGAIHGIALVRIAGLAPFAAHVSRDP